MAVTTQEGLQVYQVRYRTGSLGQRFLDEVQMTAQQAKEMRGLLRELGAHDVRVIKVERDPPLTYEEALRWIRRDF
jgi:hypothetical protein